MRMRCKPIVLTGDLKKAFLQIRIRKEDRGVLQFHWINNVKNQEMQVSRFTRLPFGLTQSPFILNGTIAEHLKKFMHDNPASGGSYTEEFVC